MARRWARLFVSITLALCLCRTVAGTVPDRPCGPIDGKLHACVKLTQCPSLLQYREPFQPETKAMLRTLHCGFDKKIPKVCCPDQFQCGLSKPRGRMSEGSTVEIEEYPWMALLSYVKDKMKAFQCGGTLISEKYVLTAAHCINPNLYGVRIGEYDINTKNDCVKEYCTKEVQNFGIENSIMHEDYSPTNFNNDIGLIRLKDAVDLTRENAGLICLPLYPDLQNLNLVGMKMTTAGWGATKFGRKSKQIQKVTIPVIDNEECNTNIDYDEIYDMAEFLNPKKICAGEEHKDSCQGDSGGPLMSLASYENRMAVVQFGVVSLGKDEKCGDGKWGIYTKVSEYLDWLSINMQP